MTSNVLKLTDMSIQFGGLKAIDSLGLEVNKGEIVAIIGPNGAGKTTAFNCITGIYRPTSGNIEYMGKSIIKNDPEEITKSGIARTFQNIRLFKNLSVFENVLIAVHLRYNDNIFTSALRLNHRQEKDMREAIYLLDNYVKKHNNNEISHSNIKNLFKNFGKRLNEVVNILINNNKLIDTDRGYEIMN